MRAGRLLSARELRGFTPLWSLHAAKRQAGVCVLLRPGLALAAPPRYSLDPDAPAERHHDEGRVVALEFAATRLLLTYTPNSGKTGASSSRPGFMAFLSLAALTQHLGANAAESLARRTAFDEQLRRFVAVPHDKPLIWCGDLNVAPDPLLDLAPSADRFIADDVAGSRPDEQVSYACACAARERQRSSPVLCAATRLRNASVKS